MTRERAMRPAERRIAKSVSEKPAGLSRKKQLDTVNSQTSNGIVESPPPLRGVLPTNPEIEAFLDKILKGRPASDAARNRIRDDLKMQYYFGGHPLMYRETEQGREVLAVGYEEMGELDRKKRKMPLGERQTIVVGWWDPW